MKKQKTNCAKFLARKKTQKIKTIKAALPSQYGGTENFIIKDVERPSLDEGQILIRNWASSVNPVDTMVREGKTRLITGLLGDHIVGSDFAGTVIESKSDRFKAGDQVVGFISAVKGGTWGNKTGKPWFHRDGDATIGGFHGLARTGARWRVERGCTSAGCGLHGWRGIGRSADCTGAGRYCDRHSITISPSAATTSTALCLTLRAN